MSGGGRLQTVMVAAGVVASNGLTRAWKLGNGAISAPSAVTLERLSSQRLKAIFTSSRYDLNPSKEWRVWLVQGTTPSPRRRRQRRRPVARPPTTTSQRRGSVSPMLALGTWALGNPLSVVTVLGLCLYGFLRYVYARFYSPLGVKPEEVGLGYGEILAQSVMGLLLFSALMFLLILIIAVLVIAAGLVWGGLIKTVWAGIREDKRIGFAFLGAVVLVTTLFVLAEAFGWGAVIVGWLALVLILWLVSLIRSRSSPNDPPPDESTSTQSVRSPGEQSTTTARRPPATASGRRRDQSRVASRVWSWFIIAVILATIVIVGLTLVLEARGGAARVLRGEAWRPTFAGTPMTSMQALPAIVVWSSGTPPSGLQLDDDHCLLYLGESNSITVLYDAGAHRTIRLPSSNVIVSVQNEEPTCVSPK